ncbi:hypothetical protein DIPPA_16285 [Diplonema papillatum]|nr:hypothetical protein DIPPA_16285 [Diplonema papillatum]
MYARALARRCFSCTATARAAVLENFFEAVDGIGVTPHGGFTWFESFHFKAARKIREKLKRCDVVIEVRGARVPFSSYNTELEKLTIG